MSETVALDFLEIRRRLQSAELPTVDCVVGIGTGGTVPAALIACSALKQTYRNILRQGNAGVQIVYLHGAQQLIAERMQARGAHFMRPEMLQSQFDTLEPPTDDEALVVRIDATVEEIVEHIINHGN